MRFLAVGDDASLGDMYMRLGELGHDVKVFIADPGCQDVLAGLIATVPDWRAELGWVGKDGIVLFEDTHFGAVQDELRAAGYRCVGGSAFGDRLENDRDFGQAAMQRAGMQTAPTFAFEDFSRARAFLRGRARRMVFKFSGPGFGCSQNYVGELDDGRDIDALLARHARLWARPEAPSFVLMDHVDGVEVGVGGYFNGRDFLEAVVIDWEHKRFFNDDLGELTGEMGTLLSYRNSDVLFEKTLARMAPQLRAVNHVGYVNINTIVNADGIWPLEFTCRFGYPGAAICETLHAEEWDELFRRMVERSTLSFATHGGFAVGVLLTVPSFPQGDRYDEISKGLPVLFRTPPSAEDRRQMHLSDIEMRDGEMLTGGELGALMIVTGRGANVEAAQAAAYARCRNVVVPGLRYRTDIGTRFLNSDRALMQKWGYWPRDA
jgi:phosphoribosylamine---glycine ligase